MDPFTAIIAFVLGVLMGGGLGGVIVYLYCSSRVAHLEAQRAAFTEKLEWLRHAQEDMQKIFGALAMKTVRKQTEFFSAQLNQHLHSHANDISRIKSSFEQNLSNLDQRIRGSADNIAVNVNQHLQSHARHIGTIKDHLQNNLLQMDKTVRELEGKREGAYQSLTQHLTNLDRAHGELRTATTNLANAMQVGPIRGRWGEIQLRKIVELAGMVQHVSFMEQAEGEIGGRPDMVVLLPNQGQMPVDSKCPMSAYLDAIACGDDAEKRAECLQLHARSVRQKIKELSDRRYWQQFDMTPEIVIMFVPIESCLVSVYECDPQIIEFAAECKVILATPLTLLAFLKAVAYGWQQFVISKNAKTILEQGKELHRRTTIWLDHLRTMGKKVEDMVEAYNKTVGSLQTRFMPAARRFQELAAIPDSAEEVPVVNRGVSAIAGADAGLFAPETSIDGAADGDGQAATETGPA